jgi:hypothetical protein
MSSVSYLLDPNIAQKPNLNIFVNSLNSLSANLNSAFINNSNQVFTNTRLAIGLTGPTGASYDPTAASILNDIYYHNDTHDIIFYLPSTNDVISYLGSTYGVSNPPPVGYTFKFKIVNKVANTVTININGDTAWLLNWSVGSGPNPSDDIIISGLTTREFTCRHSGSGNFQVAG